MTSILHRILFLAALCASASATAQTCLSTFRATTPTSRYTVDAGKGTVLDKKTGLMWKRCAEGQSGTACATGSAAYNSYYWQEALARAAESAYAGYKDWRLPNRKELVSLVEDRCSYPAINLSVFPNTKSETFWSSSVEASVGYNNAWKVYFGTGASSYDGRGNAWLVRLVRGGQ